MEEKICTCGGKMIKSEFFAGMFPGATVRVPNGYNFPKDLQVVPLVCEKCGKIEFYAGKYKDGTIVFGGVFF